VRSPSPRGAAIAQPCAFARTAVAWDGSREAVRAVHDALPLLSLSQSVQIVTMILPSAEEDDFDAESLSAHLSNHGIKIGPKARHIRTTEEREALEKEIDEGRYNLLVMGGYSHAMWFEFIFGGATQSMLLSSKIPILISH
jgi:nucleotide-binding universal stress UspA family protein